MCTPTGAAPASRCVIRLRCAFCIRMHGMVGATPHGYTPKTNTPLFPSPSPPPPPPPPAGSYAGGDGGALGGHVPPGQGQLRQEPRGLGRASGTSVRVCRLTDTHRVAWLRQRASSGGGNRGIEHRDAPPCGSIDHPTTHLTNHTSKHPHPTPHLTQVQALPSVFALRDGQVVDNFVGMPQQGPLQVHMQTDSL